MLPSLFPFRGVRYASQSEGFPCATLFSLFSFTGTVLPSNPLGLLTISVCSWQRTWFGSMEVQSKLPAFLFFYLSLSHLYRNLTLVTQSHVHTLNFGITSKSSFTVSVPSITPSKHNLLSFLVIYSDILIQTILYFVQTPLSSLRNRSRTILF